ncbi:hypothetical protein J2861_003014 [Agrobacterium tumefaciens]|nr:hypothetical protein [Agrobacterium tumefaciens]
MRGNSVVQYTTRQQLPMTEDRATVTFEPAVEKVDAVAACEPGRFENTFLAIFPLYAGITLVLNLGM